MITIAGGIVLAVLFLVSLPLIFVAARWVLALALVALCIAGPIWFLYAVYAEDGVKPLLVIGGIGAFCIAGYIWGDPERQKRRLERRAK